MTTTQIHTESTVILNVTEHEVNLPGSWFVTFGLGGPARNLFTEITFLDSDVPADDEVRELAVIDVAHRLYGNAYAFTYSPAQYDRCIGQYGMRRRERVLVTAAEVWE